MVMKQAIETKITITISVPIASAKAADLMAAMEQTHALVAKFESYPEIANGVAAIDKTEAKLVKRRVEDAPAASEPKAPPAEAREIGGDPAPAAAEGDDEVANIPAFLKR